MIESSPSDIQLGQTIVLDRLQAMLRRYGLDATRAMFRWHRQEAPAGWVLETYCGTEHFDLWIDQADLGFRFNQPMVHQRYAAAFRQVINELVNHRACKDE